MANTHVTVVGSRHEALAVLRELKGEGVPDSSITVMSSEPLHLEMKPWRKTRIPGFAIAGGFIGAAFAILLTVWTSKRVGLITGGMPIVSPWAFGIIVFELIALGAILFTLGRMIYEARLLRPRPAAYDSAISEGKIVIEVAKE
jgi:Protein of unknown function (DUF3341)